MTTSERTPDGRPLRILQVTTTPTGGDWFLDQVTGLRQRGHEVQAVVPSEGPLTTRLRAARIPTEIVPLAGWHPHKLPRVAAAELRLVRLIRRFRPDVVHAHLLKANVACRLASLLAGRPLHVNQVTGINHLHSPVLRRIDLATLSRADVLIASCRAFADRYRGFGARSVTVSYYGCDVHRLDPTTSGEPFRAEFGLAAGTPTVGMVAHMYPSRIRAFRDVGVKGHEVLIDAVPELLRRVPDAHVFVVGDQLAGDGGYRRSLEERTHRLGVDHRVHFTGHRSDIQQVLAGMDVLVNPSLEESACYAMVEALLMEKAAVASNVGGLPDTVQHGETGLLVPPGDPQALADAVADLLSDPRRRTEMGRLGRTRCLARFDIARTVEEVESVYRDALAKRSGTRW
ncbi:glycosyltransferase family 4 protein [Micromonospora endolithica]|uniref:Glycosyltransferase family 1 protein n=1 Tax=Micromonospora endolithica TaxID=230091 RepID=A0A3A9ZDT0_9ACTN|nr:glycosyltransferase family 4 protein [Micromonospora endolithica]RKN45477.1 glycosyltransferase family 1 protein [Micromonospora endolithica]TWJ22797.1 glycosyltransferase involved in cell wall biosynthesis [Micromonospora endolithica]